MGAYPGLQAVADRAAYYGMIRQSLLEDLLLERFGQDYTFTVDLDAGEFAFLGEAGQSVTATPTLVASVAPGPRSLLWGWAGHDVPGPEATATRDLGQQYGIDELVAPEVPFAADASHDSDAEVTALAHLAGLAAVEAVRAGVYYTFPAGGGTRGVLHLQGIEVPEPTIAEIVLRFPRVAEEFSRCQDARSAVVGLSEHLGWRLDWDDPHRSGATLHDGAGRTVAFGFDAQGRLSRVDAPSL